MFPSSKCCGKDMNSFQVLNQILFFPSNHRSDLRNSKKKGFHTEPRTLCIVHGTVKVLFLQGVIQRAQPPTQQLQPQEATLQSILSENPSRGHFRQTWGSSARAWNCLDTSQLSFRSPADMLAQFCVWANIKALAIICLEMMPCR